MGILLAILYFLGGLAAIVKGADWLTDGSASIARKFGIPSLVVGLTIVAMGSSAPELVVSVVAALNGNSDIALGNVVGSNIFNILGIMGITAMVTPIVVERSNIRYDVPFAILAAVAVAITALDSLLNGSGCTDSISRSDGLLLICVFIIFMVYTMSIAQKGKDSGSATSEEDVAGVLPMWRSVTYIVVGLAALIIGGNFLVDGASYIATWIGISQAVVALTIVSAGTSAPELAASIMAARKGDTAMALGNVIGSNVFNVFFVLGTAATIQPIGAGGITMFDISALIASAVLLWVLCKFGKTYYTLTRMEGGLLVVLAIAYYTVLVCCA